MALDRTTAIPYDLELRDLIDSTLYRLSQLEQAASECLRLDQELKRNESDPEIVTRKLNTQTRIFDHLEAFLAAWARLSLLLFPVKTAGFSAERGKTLQQILDLRENSVFADRELRNSWMHFDERLDDAVERQTGANRQRFIRSSELTDKLQRTTLRIIEIDTLVIHYHDKAGQPRCANLTELRTALQDLETRRAGARDKLPMPPDAA